jgi:hypothetical protein
MIQWNASDGYKQPRTGKIAKSLEQRRKFLRNRH